MALCHICDVRWTMACGVTRRAVPVVSFSKAGPRSMGLSTMVQGKVLRWRSTLPDALSGSKTQGCGPPWSVTKGVTMRRRTLDTLLAGGGLVVAAILAVACGLLFWGHHFAESSVHTQLAE